MKLQLRKRSATELVCCNETQASETECSEACRSNYPAKRRVIRLKLQKRSDLKFVGRIILHKQGMIPPQLSAKSISEACLGFIPVIPRRTYFTWLSQCLSLEINHIGLHPCWFYLPYSILYFKTIISNYFFFTFRASGEIWLSCLVWTYVMELLPVLMPKVVEFWYI